MRTIVTALVGLALILPAGPALGQEQREDRPKKQQRSEKEGANRSEGSENSITGCLAKGDSADAYVLTDEGGMKTDVSGPAALEKHVGHRVTLTGSKEGTKFTARQIKHLAASCTSGQ